MFARTESLLLRPAWAEDADALYGAIAQEQVVRNLSRVPWPYQRADAERFIARQRPAGEAIFLIFLVGAPPRLIGCIGLHAADNGETELGYWLAREAWGRGYATEAGRAVVEIARHGLRLPRLVSRHFMDNPASGRVLGKLGFQPTGHITMQHSLARGGPVPNAEYVLELNRAGEAIDVESCSVAA